MKVRYVGQSFGVDSLTSNKIYQCLGVEGGFLRVIDDSGKDYLYSAISPGSLDDDGIPPGKWEVIKDNANGDLQRAVKGK